PPTAAPPLSLHNSLPISRSPHKDSIPDHEGRHRRRFALIDVRHLSLPELLPRGRVDRDGVAVEQVVHDLTLRDGHTVAVDAATRSEEHTSELQSHLNLVC